MEKQDIRLLSNDEWLAWQKQVIREEYKEKKTQNNLQLVLPSNYKLRSKDFQWKRKEGIKNE